MFMQTTARETQLWKKRGTVPVVAGISRQEFAERFITSNDGMGYPVVVADAMDHWPARHKWDFSFFREKFGHLEIRCFHIEKRKPPYHTYEYRLKFADYIDYSCNGDFSVPPHPAVALFPQQQWPPSSTLYWAENIARPEFRPLLDDFNPDLYFVEDPMQLLPGEWKRLVFFFPHSNLFLGGPGTNVALHNDHWSSHTFIGQLQGKKHALLFAPKDKPLLFNKYNEPIDPRKPDREEFPDFEKATVFECELEPGQALFLPKNWLHDVVAITSSISLSWNFCTWHNYADYMPNILRHPYELAELLKKNPVLSKELVNR